MLPNLETDIRSLVDAKVQADPKLKSTFLYARISARAVREALISEAGYEHSELPSRQTTGEILNRLGYRLKKHYWNGTILDSVEVAIQWATNMTWKGIALPLTARHHALIG